MKLTRMLLIMLVLAVPYMIQADTIYLLDGSTLVGTLEKIDGDTLYVKPSFGGTIKLSKQLIWKIQFSDTAPPGQAQTGGGSAVMPGFTSTEPGSLLVKFNNLTISNKINVYRGRDYEGHERANTIEAVLIVDGQTVSTYVDSTTDKVIRKGVDTHLKNTIQLKDFRVELPAGPHGCQILIRNPDYPEYEKAFVNARLDLKLEIGDVIIYPARKAVVPVGLKKGFLKMGKPSLYAK